MEKQENAQQEISIELVDENPDQSRKVYDEEALNELAESISKTGLINRITVCKVGDRFKLLAGSRRYRAFKLLRLSFIPAEIVDASASKQLAIMAHENLFRADLSPMEEATFFQALLSEDGSTLQQLIHLTNKSESYVVSRLRLLACPDGIQELVGSGKLSVSAGLLLSSFPTPENIEQYTAYAISTGASLQTIRYWKQQLEAMGPIPTGEGPPAARPLPEGQGTVFGWDCFGCGTFHPAAECQTIHVCKTCFIFMERAKQEAIKQN